MNAVVSNLQKLKLASIAVVVSIGTVLSTAMGATAADTVLLLHDGISVAVPTADVRALAERGDLSEPLEQLFQTIPENPDAIQEVLTSSIRIRPSFVEENLRLSGDGEFILLQLNKVIGAPLGREDLESLEVALLEASRRDRMLSVMEVIEAYPEPVIQLKLRDLVLVYNNVRTFVERIEPLFESNAFIQDWLCECGNTVSSPDESESTQSTLLPFLVSNQDTLTTCPTVPSINSVIGHYTSTEFHPVQSSASELLKQLTVSTIETQSEVSVAANTSSYVTSSDFQNKRLVIIFGPLRPSFSIGELTEFAETGNASRSLRFYLNVANLEPEAFRTNLTQKLNISSSFLDTVLNTILGEFVLFRVGQIISTPSRQANIQALRSAIVLSSVNDNNISFLEFLQNYPTQHVHINGFTLLRTMRATNNFIQSGGRDLEDWLVDIQTSVANRFCNCASP